MKLFALIALLSAMFCTNFAQPNTEEQLQYVSILQLIAMPERFNGKRVSVIGFLSMGQEAAGLYLHREDEKNSIPDNGVAILSTTQEMRSQRASLNLKYVKIEGRFKVMDRQRFRVTGSGLEVERCVFWSDPDQPMKEQLKRLPGLSPN